MEVNIKIEFRLHFLFMLRSFVCFLFRNLWKIFAVLMCLPETILLRLKYCFPLGIKVQRPRCFLTSPLIINLVRKLMFLFDIYIWIFNILNYLYMKKYKPATFFFSWKSCLWIIFWCVPQNITRTLVSLYRFVDIFTHLIVSI